MDIQKANVLILDDEPNILKTMNICLEELGLKTAAFQNPLDAIESAKHTNFDLAFVDLKMTPLNGIQVLEELKRIDDETTVIIITAHGTVDSAVEAVKKGAYDYLQKPFDYLELQLLAKKVLEYHDLKREVKSLRQQIRDHKHEEPIITRHPAMLELLELAKRIADTNLSVLIEGESGTGKELLAQLLFQNSDRSNKPYIKVNCAALPENLLESELFGHVKGAFTGAIKDRKGRFELADGGTIFLDEITEMSPTLQAKLLRVLQNQEFERVGESTMRKVDVRTIAATNQNLDEALKEGSFREDLFYRLNAARFRLPPLRERPEDILLLAEFFIQKYAPGNSITVDTDVRKALQCYRWSGNVRELENAIQRAALLAKNQEIKLWDLPEEIQSAHQKTITPLSLEEVERQHIKKILHVSKDLTEAATILGIDPATLWRKRKRYNL